MNRSEAIAYLTRCADDNGNHWYEGRIWSEPSTCPTCGGTNDAGWLRCPGSRYGSRSDQCADYVWRFATMIDHDTSAEHLDALMSLAVNNSDELEEMWTAHAIEVSGADVDAMVTGYIECQMSVGLDYGHEQCESGEPCRLQDDPEPHPYDENYSVSNVSPEYLDDVKRELSEVVAAHPLAVRMYLNYTWVPRARRLSALFGHDFYLTRERHGAGFWDRGLGELGDYLSKIARSCGSAEVLWDNGDGMLRA